MPLQTELVDWMTRIEAEYREMPGMQLTERQMQRLWGLGGGTCAAIVQVLVKLGFQTCRPGPGTSACP